MNRPFSRSHLACGFLLASLLVGTASAAQAFGFDEVAQRAAGLAREPWRAPATMLPAALAALSYDDYRDIRYRPERALWRERRLPFELMFFHLGKYQTQAVAVNEMGASGGTMVGGALGAITGAVSSTTVTVAVQVSERPRVSVTVRVTSVAPNG